MWLFHHLLHLAASPASSVKYWHADWRTVKNDFLLWKSRGRRHCLVSVNIPVKSLTILIHFDLVFCAVRDFERQLPSNSSDTCTCSLIRHARLAGAFVFHMSWSSHGVFITPAEQHVLLNPETNIMHRVFSIPLKLLMGFATYMTCAKSATQDVSVKFNFKGRLSP